MSRFEPGPRLEPPCCGARPVLLDQRECDHPVVTGHACPPGSRSRLRFDAHPAGATSGRPGPATAWWGMLVGNAGRECWSTPS